MTRRCVHQRDSVPPVDRIMLQCPHRESWYNCVMVANRYLRYRRRSPHYRFSEAARAANRTARKYAAVGLVTGSELQALWRADSTCRYCRIGLAWREWTVDHAVPFSRGGANTIDNIVMACRSCNARKAAGMPHEYAIRMAIRGLRLDCLPVGVPVQLLLWGMDARLQISEADAGFRPGAGV